MSDQTEAREAVERVRAFRAARAAAKNDLHYRHEIIRAGLNAGDPALTDADLGAVLDRLEHLDKARDSAVSEWKREHDAADELQRERDALDIRVAELEQERDGDTRAVAALLEAVGGGDEAELKRAVLEACEYFVDRITELAARDEASSPSHLLVATELVVEPGMASREERGGQ